MREERMKVLEMINEGKITAEEGAKLLETLRCGDDSGQKFDEKFNKFSQDTKEFFKEMGCKINEMYKEVETRIRALSNKIVMKEEPEEIEKDELPE